MTTKIVKTLETDTPLPEIQARWAHVALYADIMPSVINVRSLGDQRWRWQTADGEWLIDEVQQRGDQLVSWQARQGDTVYRATVLFTPIDHGRRARIVYTRHYAHGLAADAPRQAIEADMLTTLRRSAGLLDRTGDEPITVPDIAAAASAEAPLSHVLESGETLQATLAEAADAWARSMTASITLLNSTMWPAMQAQQRKQKQADKQSELQA
ncbi:MAG: hypothetical protein WAQ08_14225 [Aquabacterium sp.]|jgi:hypothetical protein|uniref:hypothetical protein n=1 Tax=Aquabacterium sp. TaxID=1872578 RepID=UPI003BB0CD6F